ncbi:DUF7563 family protein [Salinigranum halophilum]|nr:hypothetical protein [Salinigranum halophilum]
MSPPRRRTHAPCDHCRQHVSDRFARAFPDTFGRAHLCPSCTPNEGIAEVARRRAQEEGDPEPCTKRTI